MRAKQTGFSLIELLVVLVILGLLAGVVGPNLMNKLSGARSDTAKLDIENLSSALDIYRLETGSYPTTDEGLQALLTNPGEVAGWNGPYLKKNKMPQDPWKQAYQYISPGEHGEYDLFSNGRDKAVGGEGEDADIVSWE